MMSRITGLLGKLMTSLAHLGIYPFPLYTYIILYFFEDVN